MLDKDQIEKLINLHYADIYHYCVFLCRSQEDADDIAQETFELLIEKADKLEYKNLRSWLYCVATNKIKKFYRENDKHQKVIEPDFDVDLVIDELAYSVDEQVVAAEYTAQDISSFKEKILSSLSAEDQILYRAIYIEHKKQKELAAELNISPKAANLRAYRLKHRLEIAIKTILCLIFLAFCSFF